MCDFRAQNDAWQHITHWQISPESTYLVCCPIIMRLRTEGLNSTFPMRTSRDRGRLAKTILNTVMALSTLPELHLIILYLSSFFFLKSNSPQPFFQGGFLVSTYRSFFFFSSNYKIKAISLHKVLLIHTLTKSYVEEKRNWDSSSVELNKPILIWKMVREVTSQPAS